MLRRVGLILATLAMHSLVLSSTASAHTSVVADPQGDVPATAPAYVDIVQAKVTEQIGKGTFYFKVELAGAVPGTPARSFVAWNWFIDSPGGVAPFDYIIVVRWCSRAVQAECGEGPAHWESFFINFRTGTGALNVFSFKIEGATVKAFIDPALIGDPTRFNWLALSRLVPAGRGAPIDLAPSTPPPATFTR